MRAQPLRCPNCDKRLGERLEGLYENECPRCHKYFRLVRNLAKGIDTSVILDRVKATV